MPLEKFFKGKSVLVTGAGQGIGRAVAERLDSYGAKVYAVSRSKGPLDSLAKECPNVIPIQLDVGVSWDETRKVVGEMKDLDVVINNAAILGEVLPFLDVTEEFYDRYSNVNLKAVANISQVAAKNMIANKKKGTIINISSFAALRVYDMCSVYCTLKAGLDMLTKCMALELGKHSIRVNSINMGLVKTPALVRGAGGGDDEAVRAVMLPALSKSALSPDFLPLDEVVNMILFAASDLVPTLTGSCLVYDGGITLC